MYLSRDVLDAADDFLQRERTSWTIVTAFPELKGVILLDDGRPFLKIPFPSGGYVTIATMARHRVLRWVAAVPDTPGLTIHEPSSLEEYPRLVGEALGLEHVA